MKLGKLKSLRKAAQLTQYGLHRKSGVPRGKICLAESGDVELTNLEIAAIRRALLREIRKGSSRLNEVLRSPALTLLRCRR